MSCLTCMWPGRKIATQTPQPLLMNDTSSGTGTTSQYSSKALHTGEIRLVILYPGTTHEKLRAVVCQSPLRQTGNFQAISYTWGSRELTHTLWTPEGNVQITNSLHDALCSLRHETTSLLLWADGICINQQDLKEKAEQIRLLPHVFKSATCVLVILGSDADGEAAVEALMQIRVNEALKGLNEQWPDNLAPIPSHWNKRPIPPAQDGVWSDIKAFFDRPWFRRSWIIQAVVAAISVRVICGKWMVDRNDLFIALEVIKREEKPSIPESWISSVSSFPHSGAATRAGGTTRPQNPLGTSRQLPDGRTDFIIDYEIPFDDLVLKYAWTFIGQGMVMELLHRAGASNPPTKHIPSWVPDWAKTRQNSLRSLARQGMPCAALWRAEPRIKSSISDELGGELAMHGTRVDEIRDVSKSINLMDQISAYLDEVERMCKRATTRLDNNARWEIPIASASRRRVEGPGMRESYEALREYWRRRDNQSGSSRRKLWMKNVGLNVTKQELWERSQNYVLALQDCLSGWRFVTTKTGLAGVATPAVVPGDTICILDGAVVPFVLRKSAEVSGGFELVGECYIHGLMNGEGVHFEANDSIIVLC